MRMPSVLVLSAVLFVSTAAAGDENAKTSGDFHPALFCEGTYALCIKAPCSSDPSDSNRVKCVCDVVKGWSMGPESCEVRSKTLISTYSNLYNDKHKTLACDDSTTVWAWCYGAPCIADEKDPSKAVCNCPVKTSASRTLGGKCQQEACKAVWSAATPVADTFANVHFYEYMKKNHPKVPVNPPAKPCEPEPGGKP